MNRLRISLKKNAAMEINRISIGDLKLCYVICANKKIKYPSGSSPVVYIGTTKNGIARVAPSAAYRAGEILNEHGINSLRVRIVTCGGRRGVQKPWHKLERALLLGFKKKYGDIPHCNRQGINFVETKEFLYFARKRINDILNDLENVVVADQEISDRES